MTRYPLSLFLLVPQEETVAARFRIGNPPELPPLAANGGLVGLELRIAPSGIVKEAIVIDDSPPFTEEIKKVVRLWIFHPEREDGARVDGRVAVIALFRGPTLVGGGSPPPERISSPSPEIPYPTSIATPAYPPRALYSGVVMLELEVDETGEVTHVEVLDDEEGFAPVAVETAGKFRFRPAKSDGRPVFSRALLIFGFPQPLTTRRPR